MTTNTDGAMPELLPCPFCGDSDIFIEPDEKGSGGQWVGPIHVGCTKCQAEQCADDEADAIAAWNRRAAIQQAAGAVPKMPTVPDNMQDWAGMDGTTAWHLIERHADNWADIGKMMGEWLAANSQQPVHLGGGEGGGAPQPRYRLLNSGDVIEKHDEFIQDDGVTWLNPVGWEVGARYGPPFKTARRPESPTGQINQPAGQGMEGGE